MIIFGKCGHKIEYFANEKPAFCPKCGTPLGSETFKESSNAFNKKSDNSVLDFKFEDESSFEDEVPNGLEGVRVDTSDMGGTIETTDNNNTRVKYGVKFGSIAATSNYKIPARAPINKQAPDDNFFKDFSKKSGPAIRGSVNYQDIEN